VFDHKNRHAVGGQSFNESNHLFKGGWIQARQKPRWNWLWA
jgi:hypothetical protein